MSFFRFSLIKVLLVLLGVSLVVSAAGGVLPSRVAATPIAQASTANLPPLLRGILPQLKRDTRIPILLPSQMPPFPFVEDSRIAQARGSRDEYFILLTAPDRCLDEAMCFAGILRGRRGEQPNSRIFRQEVRLARRITGYYRPLLCASDAFASCAWPAIQWVDRSVLYEMEFWLPDYTVEDYQAAMVQAANSAINAGAR
jgi:hypothetical protein